MKLFIAKYKLLFSLLFIFLIIESIVKRVIVSRSALSLRPFEIEILRFILNVQVLNVSLRTINVYYL